MKRKVNWLKILLTLIIIILIIISVYKFFTKEKHPDEVNYIETLQDGTKRNTSENLKETKTINGIELSNIELLEKTDGTIELSATAKNTTAETTNTNMIQVKLLSKDNQTIGNIYVSVSSLGPNSTMGVKGTMKEIDISKVHSAEIKRISAVK